MVQSTVDGRSRARRTKQSEEQAPLVESYLSSNSSTIYNGEEEERDQSACDHLPGKALGLETGAAPRRTAVQSGTSSTRSSRTHDTRYDGLFQRAANLRKRFEAGD